MNTTDARREKHIPLRMCVVCRKMLPKSGLIRLIRTGGKIFSDKQESLSGKGIYLCPVTDCLNMFLNHKKFRKTYLSLLSDEALKSLAQLKEKFEGKE